MSITHIPFVYFIIITILMCISVCVCVCVHCFSVKYSFDSIKKPMDFTNTP